MTIIENENPGANWLLRIFTFMKPDGISLDRAKRSPSKRLSDVQSPLSRSPVRFKTISSYISIWWESDENLMRIYRLIQSVGKDQMTMDELDRHQKLVCQVVRVVCLSSIWSYDEEDLPEVWRWTYRYFLWDSRKKSEDLARQMGWVGTCFLAWWKAKRGSTFSIKRR